MRRTIRETKRLADPNIAPPDQLAISPEENGATIRKLFDEKFPSGTEFGAPLPKPPVVTAPPAPAERGVFRRVIDAVTFRSQREDSGAAPANPPRTGKDAPPAASPASGTSAASGEVSATPPEISTEEMSERLAEATTVDDNDLRVLAQARAQRVRDYFENVGKISPERLFLAKDRANAEQQRKGPRVFLGLQ